MSLGRFGGGLVGGGGGLPLLLTITPADGAIAANTTGVVAQLASRLAGASFDEHADVAGVTIAPDGAVTLTTGLAAGATRTVNARVTGTLFLASVVVSAVFVLTGGASAPPAFAPSLDFSDARNGQYFSAFF